MRRVLKWIGIVLGSLIGLVVLALVGLYVKSRLDFSTKCNVQVESVSVPTDAASIARGQHLATILCEECHGKDLGGTLGWFLPGMLGTADTPNLTTGKGGLGSEFTDADFVRVLRHGVKPDGTSVFIMPSPDFYYLSETDLGDVIAYIRSVPPVDRQTPEPHVRLSFVGNVMVGVGPLGSALRARTIDQASHPPAPAQAGITPECGAYMVRINGCRGCHAQQLAGGRSGDPNSPLAPNLTPGGELSVWTETQFITTLRTGATPSGMQLPDRFMPWTFKGQMTDDELKAVFAYLKSLPELPTSTAPADQ